LADAASSLQQGLSQQVPSHLQLPVAQQQPSLGQPSAQQAHVQPHVSPAAEEPAKAQGPTASANRATTVNTAEIESNERNMILILSGWKI